MSRLRFVRSALLLGAWLLLALPGTARAAPEDAEVYLTNQAGEEVEVFQLDAHGNGRSVGTIATGRSMYLRTQVGARWLVKTKKRPRRELLRFTVKQREEDHVLRAPAATDPARAPAAAAGPKLTIENRRAEDVTLLQRTADGIERAHARIPAGSTWEGHVAAGSTWVLGVGPDLTQIDRFQVGRTDLRRVVPAAGSPAPAQPAPPGPATPVTPAAPPRALPPPPPFPVAPPGRWIDPDPLRPPGVPPAPHRPAGGPPGVPGFGPGGVAPRAPTPAPRDPQGRRTQRITVPVEAFGIWRHVHGDTEMDTDGRDRVPVEARSRLVIGERGVLLVLWFSCREHGGDGTAFQGPERTFEVASVENGRVPAGWRVVGLRAAGGRQAAFRATSIGRQHGRQRFDTRGSYWDRLAFRVDGRGRRDDRIVGLAGTLSFEITLAPR